MQRVLPALALAVLTLAASRLWAEEEKKETGQSGTTWTARVLQVEGNKLTLAGPGDKEQMHTVPGDARITVDGKPGKVADIRKGMLVQVTTRQGDPKTLVRVEATTRPSAPDEPRPPGK